MSEEQAMHKDLEDDWRAAVVGVANDLVTVLTEGGQSLARAREAWINAFDKAAEELDGGSHG